MSDARQQLLTLLSQQSFRLGQFKLSSGGTSDYYIDCRATTLHAEGARLTGRVFLDEIERRDWHPQAIGGLTMGADPIVVSVAMLSAQEADLAGSNAAAAVQAKMDSRLSGAQVGKDAWHRAARRRLSRKGRARRHRR
jgi:orotate phosphoribosyltransferase